MFYSVLEGVQEMSSLVKRKKEKVAAVKAVLGDALTKESFISTFKTMYPEDWKRICEKWQQEEDETPPGKRHPMQHPDVYMREMYRNQCG